MQVQSRLLFPTLHRFQYLFPVVVLLVAIVTSVAVAQTGGVDSTGTGGRHTISGRIYFPSGRRSDVPVKVKLQSLNSGELTVFSDVNGSFAFRGLTPGSYTVVVDAGADYDVAREGVYIEQEASNPRRGVVLPTFSKLYTVDINLRLKQDVHLKAGVVSAALASVPDAAKDLYLKAVAFAAQGDSANAITQLKAALEIFPEFPLALNELGVQYLKTGNPDKASESLSKAVKLSPDSFQPRLNYGIALLNLRKLPDAEDQLRVAVNKENSAPTAHMYLGIVLAIQRKLEEGTRELELAVASKSNEIVLAHRYLGGIYYEKKDYEAAANELELYLKLVPKASDAEVLRQKIKEWREKK